MIPSRYIGVFFCDHKILKLNNFIVYLKFNFLLALVFVVKSSYFFVPFILNFNRGIFFQLT